LGKSVKIRETDDDEFFGGKVTQIKPKRQKYPQPIKQNVQFRKKLLPKSYGQEMYVRMLDDGYPVLFCYGASGTGKSILAAQSALEKLLSNEVEKILVTRPIVPAGVLTSGEFDLGALPGELEDKVLPYFMPTLNCMEELIGAKMVDQLMEEGRIEFAPLAYQRGKTFKDCIVLVEESQNMSVESFKLLLTRISENCQMVFTGDTKQSDVKTNQTGFEQVITKLRGKSPDICVVELTKADIQRHPLISLILDNLE
jgi:phosphate starvation-inducible PhoH-like protein